MCGDTVQSFPGFADGRGTLNMPHSLLMNEADYLTEIEQVIKPELQPIIQGLNEEDPHDLIRPDSWF